MSRLVLTGNAIRLAHAARIRQKDAWIENGVEAPRWSREAKLSCSGLQVQVSYICKQTIVVLSLFT